MILSPVMKLASLAEELAPGLLQKAAAESDEISALTETVTTITTEMKSKEQTWIGDLEQRNQAVRQLSRTLQEQAASFETALNSMDLPICLFESSGTLLQANQRFSQFLELSTDSMKARGFLPIIAQLDKHTAAPGKLTAAAEAIYRKPSVACDATFPLREGGGTVRLYCVPIFGELSSLVGVMITTGSSSAASEVDYLKGEFISTVSHELRTPLTAIRGAVGLVLGGAGGPVPGPIHDLLEIASTNTERLIQLVNDILEIFRVETGKLQLRTAPAVMSELVGKACARQQKEAEAAKVSLETRIAQQLPLVSVDTEQVQTVLEKLISNAIKFSDQGGTVRIGVEPMRDNPKFLLAWVQDHGHGIPAEAQERIFQKFEQAERVATRQHQGSGLGLSICRGIVEAHGGRLWVKSEPGKGSTFYLTLPTAPPQPQPRPTSPTVAPSPAFAARRLVMVVEDDSDTRDFISRLLQSVGHFVLEASTGTQVTELAMRHQPDLILLDQMLPDVPGLEVLRHLKANENVRNIPVICISVSADFSPQALRLGAVQFLRRPLDAGTLMRAIHGAMRLGAKPAG
jgi:signal transduction histidine kinase/CheY-like chemotaxis protein